MTEAIYARPSGELVTSGCESLPSIAAASAPRAFFAVS